jgi:hypothetical protein
MKKIVVAVPVILATVILTGCAGSTPSADFRKTLTSKDRLCEKDVTTVNLTTAQDVDMVEQTKTRIAQKLTAAIEKKKKTVQCETLTPREYVLDAKITRYDEGNAFARAMLAGLGQMHIDGEFKMAAKGQLEPATDFTLAKTFAWGGAYGASVRIEDIENTFTESVAKVLVLEEQQAKGE